MKLLAILLVLACPISAKAQVPFLDLEKQFLLRFSFATLEASASKYGFEFRAAKQVDTPKCYVYYLFEKEGQSLIAYTGCSGDKNFTMVETVKLVLYDHREFDRLLQECRTDKEITYHGEYMDNGAVSYTFSRNTVVAYSFKIRPGNGRTAYSVTIKFTPTYR